MPAIRSQGLEKTGVETAASPEVRSCSRHQTRPVFGSSEVTASWVQTMSCFFPPAARMMGELYVKESSSARQASFPEFLSKATTQAAGFPQMYRISNWSSIKGEA